MTTKPLSIQQRVRDLVGRSADTQSAPMSGLEGLVDLLKDVDPYLASGITRAPTAPAVRPAATKPTPARPADDNVVHYWHIGVETVRRSGAWVDERWTFAYRYNSTTGDCSFGVSFCSPNDQFSKAKGREGALARLNSSPTRLQLRSGLSWGQVCEAMFQYLSLPLRQPTAGFPESIVEVLS